MALPPSLFHTLVGAARAFNSAQYFEAHEILEEALDDVPDELWNLWIGLIQIAVGYHKVTQQLRGGAAGMLERGLRRVAPFPHQAGGINLEPLRTRVRADRDALRAGTFDDAAFSFHPPRLQLLRG